LKKCKKNRNSTTDLHKIWHDDAERVSSAPPVKKFILKIQDGGRPKRLTDQCCNIARYCNLSIFNMAAVRHLGNFEIEIFNSQPL